MGSNGSTEPLQRYQVGQHEGVQFGKLIRQARTDRRWNRFGVDLGSYPSAVIVCSVSLWSLRSVLVLCGSNSPGELECKGLQHAFQIAEVEIGAEETLSSLFCRFCSSL